MLLAHLMHLLDSRFTVKKSQGWTSAQHLVKMSLQILVGRADGEMILPMCCMTVQIIFCYCFPSVCSFTLSLLFYSLLLLWECPYFFIFFFNTSYPLRFSLYLCSELYPTCQVKLQSPQRQPQRVSVGIFKQEDVLVFC